MHWTHRLIEWKRALRAGAAGCQSRFDTIAALAFLISSVVAPPCPAFDAGRKARGVEWVVDHVERIELNHYLNWQTGEVHLDQIIFWGYSPALESFVVIDWRSLKEFSQVPWKCRGGYRVAWFDKRDTCYREVFAKSFVETFTDYDAETTNQDICDRNFRRGLSVPARMAVKK